MVRDLAKSLDWCRKERDRSVGKNILLKLASLTIRCFPFTSTATIELDTSNVST